jgi:hypothetical protein
MNGEVWDKGGNGKADSQREEDRNLLDDLNELREKW